MTFPRRAELAYAIGLLGAALIVLAEQGLPSRFSGMISGLLFTVSVLAAATLNGWRAGVIVMVFELLVVDFFLIDPVYSFWINDLPDFFRLMTFSVLGAIISGLCELLRRAWKRSDDRQRRLEQEVDERRKAEISAQARAEELHVTLASIGEGVITTSAQGRILYLNRSAENLTGWTEADAAGLPLETVYRLADAQTSAEIPRKIPDVFRDRQTARSTVHATLLSKTGEERSIDETISPIRNSTGELIGAVLVFRDVAEQRRSQEELRQSEQRFARFMQHLPGLAWIKDLQGRYSFVNDAAEKAFRTPRSELIGKTDLEIFPPETAAQFMANDRLALQSDAGVRLIETLPDETGMLHYSIVHKFPVPDHDGRTSLVGGVAVDVTDRLTAEQELRRHKERLELAQHAGQVGSFEWQIPTGDVEWSAIEEEIFGVPAGDFGGRYFKWKQAIHPDDRKWVLTECIQSVRHQSDLDIQFRITRPDGEIRWIAVRGKVYADERGKPLRMVGVNVDITERKLAELARQDADRRKDEFLATLAHELRNPLAPVQNSLELLKIPGVEPDTARQARDMMERQVQQLVRLVDDLLDVSRVMRGKIDLRTERVELSAIVSRAAETAQLLMQQHGHTLKIDLPDEPLPLLADSIRLSQALGNLLTNAAKYTEPHGTILLAARRDGDYVVLSVRDNGIGIPRDMLQQIFELFVQANQAIARAHGGLGIGLTLVKNLVELHGGTIQAHSDGPGRGSEFVVRLPLCVPSDAWSPNGSPPAETIGRTGQRHRLLIVDDNQDAARSLAMLLRIQGHDVMVSHDGPSALEAGETFHPEMVFLDLGMPGMDGYEVARRFRGHPSLQHVVLTALTGWGQMEDRRRTAEAGFDHHLVKPAEVTELNRVLAELASSRN